MQQNGRLNQRDYNCIELSVWVEFFFQVKFNYTEERSDVETEAKKYGIADTPNDHSNQAEWNAIAESEDVSWPRLIFEWKSKELFDD